MTDVHSNNEDLNESNPRSNVHYLGSGENKAWKKFRPVRTLSAVQIYDFHIFSINEDLVDKQRTITCTRYRS